jgi:hypothetical protein
MNDIFEMFQSLRSSTPSRGLEHRQHLHRYQLFRRQRHLSFPEKKRVLKEQKQRQREKINQFKFVFLFRGFRFCFKKVSKNSDFSRPRDVSQIGVMMSSSISLNFVPIE